ncbi:uncharacterized protein LOC108683206 [Hyalella azteca]|uniref:Uncharacterized protein LOC108683206 n=1 Tax=Hyalella azteca TaxID=294128 RepID=A0A8B7PP60_HYAAZ|nr:uncharacterized protein LOC108683206 [Hyalella azteca]
MVGQSRALILLCGTLLGLLCALYAPSRALSLPGLSREHLDEYLGVHERQEGELLDDTTVSTEVSSTDDISTDATTTDVTTTDAGATGVTTSSSESASTSDTPGTTPGVSSTAEVVTNSSRNPTDEMAAKKDIDDMDVVLQKSFVIMQEASWLENTDHTDAHASASIEATANFSSVYAQQWKEVINFYEYWNFTDPELRRRFELQAKPGTTVLSPGNQTKGGNMDECESPT